jgi:hypothetical protein
MVDLTRARRLVKGHSVHLIDLFLLGGPDVTNGFRVEGWGADYILRERRICQPWRDVGLREVANGL